MERYWDRRTENTFGVVCLLMVVFWFCRSLHTQIQPPLPGMVLNNPNAFVAWSTNTSVHYTFTYDPHAADVWRFETGGTASPDTNNFSLAKPKWIWMAN